jgi:predicted RNA binding protein YcfA (HicA-like mRNA interferase family)
VKRLTGKQMCRVLERHGWQLARVAGSHHIYTRPGHRGSPSVPVHGNRTLKPKTQRNIMRAAGLTDADL